MECIDFGRQSSTSSITRQPFTTMINNLHTASSAAEPSAQYLIGQRRKYFEMLVDNIQHTKFLQRSTEDDVHSIFGILRGRVLNTTLHSKLRRKQWPNVVALQEKLVQFLEDSLRESVEILKDQIMKLPVKVSEEYLARLEDFRYTPEEFQASHKLQGDTSSRIQLLRFNRNSLDFNILIIFNVYMYVLY